MSNFFITEKVAIYLKTTIGLQQIYLSGYEIQKKWRINDLLFFCRFIGIEKVKISPLFPEETFEL